MNAPGLCNCLLWCVDVRRCMLQFVVCCWLMMTCAACCCLLLLVIVSRGLLLSVVAYCCSSCGVGCLVLFVVSCAWLLFVLLVVAILCRCR